MTFKKYLRLVLVLLLPLFGIGYWLSEYFYPYGKFRAVLCRDSGSDGCEDTGGMDYIYDSIIATRPAWFEVKGAVQNEGRLRYYVQASYRAIGDVNIVTSETYWSATWENSEATEPDTSLAGTNTYLTFGVPEGTASLSRSSRLYCEGLWYDFETAANPNPGPYTATCSTPDWRGSIDFTPTIKGREILEILRTSIDKQASWWEYRYLVRQVAKFFFPFMVFLVVSLLAWISVKAFRFVRAG